jgi:hypothetical protein
MRTYLTGAELCRALNIPQSRLATALDAGLIAADGRAGNNANSAIIFALDRIDAIRAALESGAPAPKPKQSRDCSEITDKAKALIRAREEVAP